LLLIQLIYAVIASERWIVTRYKLFMDSTGNFRIWIVVTI